MDGNIIIYAEISTTDGDKYYLGYEENKKYSYTNDVIVIKESELNVKESS